MKAIFQRLITDFHESFLKKTSLRDYSLPIFSKKIISLIGVRRSGKTFLLFSLINELIQKVDMKNLIYINFEDDRLYPLALKDLDDLLEGYYELFPEKRSEKIYLFFDEIQNIPEWERYVRRIYDTENIQLYVTGSSSKLLSQEIATSLRGRTISYEIFPFSFHEYLVYRQININMHSSKSISFIKNAFSDYIFQGGFAETIGEEKDIRQKILHDYLDLIIYRDLVDRFDIKNRVLLKHLIKYIFSNPATLLSVNKLFNEYKSRGFKLSKDTLYQYLQYLEDAYAVFSVPIFRGSVREEQRHPQKIYSIDNGFKTLFTTAHSKDFSKLYENLVFLQLRRKTREIYYFKQRQEVDFYVPSREIPLLNVSYNLSTPATFEREIKGLEEAMDYFATDHSLLITEKREEVYQKNGKTIMIVPLWKWLLSEEKH